MVELAVHQLDLAVARVPAQVALARRTLEALADADLPAELDDPTAGLAGLGRIGWPLDAVP